MIKGFFVDCQLGGYEVLRSPRIRHITRRRDVLSQCEVDVPDATGEVRSSLQKKMPVKLKFGLRGGDTHEWKGWIRDISLITTDLIRVGCVGLEQALIDNKALLAMYDEPADVVGKRLLAMSGLPVASVDIPGDKFPNMVFSNCTIARGIRQLTETLERAYGHDMSKHAVWLGQAGLYWSPESEPGQVYVLETAENLISNDTNPQGMRRAVATVQPGLVANREVRIRDIRTGQNDVVRADEVTHLLNDDSVRTIVGYNCEEGWGR